jgi:hypothetical protein
LRREFQSGGDLSALGQPVADRLAAPFLVWQNAIRRDTAPLAPSGTGVRCRATPALTAASNIDLPALYSGRFLPLWKYLITKPISRGYCGVLPVPAWPCAGMACQTPGEAAGAFFGGGAVGGLRTALLECLRSHSAP